MVVAERRSKGDEAIYFEHDGPCKDGERHRRCPGRWRGEITIGLSSGGKRLRRRVSGRSKAAVQDALKDLRKELETGIQKAPPPNYTVDRCCEDWLTDGLPGRDPNTVAKNSCVLAPVRAAIGSIRLKELKVADVDRALAAVAKTRSSATVAMAHQALSRAITRAQAHDLVMRNVSALTATPPGQRGRPSRSVTLAQAMALTAAAKSSGRGCMPTWCCRCARVCGPRKRGRCDVGRWISANPVACRRGPRAWRCGVR